MGQKTIPQLQTATTIDENALLVVDSGIQTYKISAPNLAKALRGFATPVVVAEQVAGFSVAAIDEGKVFPLNSISGSFNAQLPDPADVEGMRFSFKDVGGKLSEFPVTLVRDASEEIEGVAADYALSADFGCWTIYSNGTDYVFVT